MPRRSWLRSLFQQLSMSQPRPRARRKAHAGSTTVMALERRLMLSGSAPVASDVSTSTLHDQTVSDSVSGYTWDLEGDPLTFSLDSGPSNGSASVNADGSFTYTPNPGFVGTDSFVYDVSDGTGSDQATVTISVTNTAPYASDDYYSTLHGQSLSDTVASGDWDAEWDPLTFSLGQNTANGSVSINLDGSFTYTPHAGFVGTDSFTYTVTDGIDSASATATISVTNQLPIAADDTFSTPHGRELHGNVAVNDSDPDGDSLLYTMAAAPTNGTVIQVNDDGTFTYTPNPGFVGTDQFTYWAADGAEGSVGMVTIEVTNSPPVAGSDHFTTPRNQTVSDSVAHNDFDLDGDALIFSLTHGPTNGTLNFNADGSFQYVPNTGYSGTDTFTYEVTDGIGSMEADVAILVLNMPPVAVPDQFSTPRNQTLSGSVAENDFDLDGDPLAFSLSSGPSHGQITFDISGSFSYTPNSTFAGYDTFQYTVTDGTATSFASVMIEVTNSPPTAWDETDSTIHDQSLSGSVADNASDPDGDALTFSLQGGPSHGVAVVNDDGSYTYTPADHFAGSDSFTFAVTDGIATTTATVSIEVLNNAPMATEESASVVHDGFLEGSVADNASDPDGDAITFSLGDGPSHGQAVVNVDGSYEYTPNTQFVGSDSFTYVVTDGIAETTATVSIQVTNTAPTGVADDYRVVMGREVSFRPGWNDSDAENDPITEIVIVEGPQNGTATVSGMMIRYTPNAGYFGEDTFTYRPSDGMQATTVGSESTVVSLMVFDPAGVRDVTLATLAPLGDEGEELYTTITLAALPTDDPALDQAAADRAQVISDALATWTNSEGNIWQGLLDAFASVEASLAGVNQSALDALSLTTVDAAISYAETFFAALEAQLNAEEVAGEQWFQSISSLMGVGTGGGGGSSIPWLTPTTVPNPDPSWAAAFQSFDAAILAAEAAHTAAVQTSVATLDTVEADARMSFVSAVEDAAGAYTNGYVAGYVEYLSTLISGVQTYRDEFLSAREEFREQRIEDANQFRQEVAGAISEYLDGLRQAKTDFENAVEAAIGPALNAIRDAFAAYVQAEADYDDQASSDEAWRYAQKDLAIALAETRLDVAEAGKDAFLGFMTSEQTAMTEMATEMAQAEADWKIDEAAAIRERDDRVVNALQQWDIVRLTASSTLSNAVTATEVAYDLELEVAHSTFAAAMFAAAANYDSQQLAANLTHDGSTLDALGSLLDTFSVGTSSSGWGSDFAGTYNGIIGATAALDQALTGAAVSLMSQMDVAATQQTTTLAGAHLTYQTTVNGNELAAGVSKVNAHASYDLTVNGLDEAYTTNATSQDVSWTAALAAVVSQRNIDAAQGIGDGIVTAAQTALDEARERPDSDYELPAAGARPSSAEVDRYRVETDSLEAALEPRTQPEQVTDWPGAENDEILLAAAGAGDVTLLVLQSAFAAASSRQGHHWIPQSVFEALDDIIGDDAVAVFKAGVTDPLVYNHGFDTWDAVTHAQYNTAVSNLLQQYQQRVGTSNRLSTKQAEDFLKWIKGQPSDIPQGVLQRFSAADLAHVNAWRQGFIDSIMRANEFLAKAEQMNIELDKKELKYLVRTWQNGTNHNISRNAAAVYKALQADYAGLSGAARVKRFQFVKRVAILGVVWGIYEGLADVRQGYAGEGHWESEGIPGALIQLADGSARRFAMKEEVEAYIVPVFQNGYDSVHEAIGTRQAPNFRRRALQRGVDVSPTGD